MVYRGIDFFVLQNKKQEENREKNAQNDNIEKKYQKIGYLQSKKKVLQ